MSEEQPSICARCGEVHPLRRRRYVQVSGLLFHMRHETEGDYCEACSRKVYLRTTGTSLVSGWWSPQGIVRLPGVLWRNTQTWIGPGEAPVALQAVQVREARFSTEITLDFSKLPPVQRGSPWGAEWWIAISHLRSRQPGDFISLTTFLSVVGVIVGVAVLNWVLSVMTGFEEDLRDKILGANAHVVVLSQTGQFPATPDLLAKASAVEGVEAAAPFIYSEMMIRSAWGAAGIILKGMDPATTGSVTSIRDNLVLGPAGPVEGAREQALLFSSVTAPIPAPVGSEDKELPGIFIGVELQEQLHVLPGDKVQIINPLGQDRGIMGMPTPSVRAFRIAGVFDSGMYEYDTKWTYVLNEEAQSFLGIGAQWTGIEARVLDEDRVEVVAQALVESLGAPYYTRQWKELNQPLFEALEMEKWVMGLILSTIVGVAALAIVTTQVMLVLTKGREIAILKAMGASEGSILRIFVLEGALIGVVGAALGTAFGLVGCEAIARYEYPLETDVYYLSSLPVVVDSLTVVVVAIAALTLSFLATLYPAWKAASLHPVEGLRYE